ncbi:MAG: hypothetical protein HYT98_03450 [Candidatus Sungbacteria bacterium]|nr:hypothetical protein [Candidatus Sungbacteria bacterium]
MPGEGAPKKSKQDLLDEYRILMEVLLKDQPGADYHPLDVYELTARQAELQKELGEEARPIDEEFAAKRSAFIETLSKEGEK